MSIGFPVRALKNRLRSPAFWVAGVCAPFIGNWLADLYTRQSGGGFVFFLGLTVFLTGTIAGFLLVLKLLHLLHCAIREIWRFFLARVAELSQAIRGTPPPSSEPPSELTPRHAPERDGRKEGETINISIPSSRLVVCPKCRQHNRVREQERNGVYTCGSCKHRLPNPFSTWNRLLRGLQRNALLLTLSAIFVFLLWIAVEAWSPEAVSRRSPVVETSGEDGPAPYRNPSPAGQPRYFSTGTILARSARTGLGRLSVENGTGRDAVVKIVDEARHQIIVAFYVQSGSTGVIDRIPDGTFQAIFALGSGWDPIRYGFSRDRAFSRFDKSLVFATEADERVYRFSELHLTLHKVVNGNTTITQIAEAEFSKY
jgi:hypothetical protein